MGPGEERRRPVQAIDLGESEVRQNQAGLVSEDELQALVPPHERGGLVDGGHQCILEGRGTVQPRGQTVRGASQLAWPSEWKR